WLGDVGQDDVEEVNVVERGGNYGWSQLEGRHCYAVRCVAAGATEPVASYTHDAGCAIAGGVVYRGAALPALAGRYLFADYCTGEVSMLGADGQIRGLARADRPVSSLASDAAGEVYVLQFRGPVLR